MPLVDAVEAAVHGGVDCVQLREKDLPAAELYRLARDVRAITARAGVPLLVNDRVDIALAVKAHGVHLGARSIPIADARRLLHPGDLIGYSAHSAEEAEGAALAGADFVFFAPVFEPGSKALTAAGEKQPAAVRASGVFQPQGLEKLRHVAAVCPVPVYALGGITRERIPDVMRRTENSGRSVAGVAVISALLGASDIAAEARRFREAIGR